MRLKSASWHNMGPFGEQGWSLDLTALPPEQKVIALTGINGKGKSYCMESAVAGGCYRVMPTQGTVSGRATAADSWQSSSIEHAGQSYTIKHLVNAATQRRSAETIVTDENGKPVYEGTGVKLFEGWAATHLPDPDVLFASLFAAQQSEGFVKMTSCDRIGIILRVIGVARYERMAALARKRRDEQAEKLDGLVKRIADIRGGGLTVEQCEMQLATANETVAGFEAQLTERRDGLEAARQADAQARVLLAQRDAAVQQRLDLQQQLSALVEKRKPVAEMVKNNRAVLEQAELIRKAATTVTQTEAQLRAAESELAVARAALDASRAAARDVGSRYEAALVRSNRAKTRAADAPAVQAAKLELPALRDALAEAEADVAKLQAKLEELQSAHIAGAAERIVTLRAGLNQVANLDPDVHDICGAVAIAQDAIGFDDEAVAAAQQAPTLTKEAKDRLALARDRLAVAQRQVADAERLAARSVDVDSAEAELREAASELQGLLANGSAAKAEAEAKEQAVVDLTNKLSSLQAIVVSFKPLAGRLAPLENAESRLAVLDPQLAEIDTDVARVEAAAAALPPLPDEPQRPDLNALQAQLERTEGLLRFERDGLARLQQSLEGARAVEAKVADLEAERRAVEAELGVCTRLALDLGRTGLQSAEVDSAGPELTELVNDLLHTCHGPRFTVSVDTQRLTSDGKKTVDECLITVIDTEKGTEKEVREHSGGERVILGEAISLALTMLACRRAGFDRPTLFRDESAAALDPANARAWVAMMRRAVELTGADRLLFVSHSPEVVEMADAQIPVGEPAAVEARAA